MYYPDIIFGTESWLSSTFHSNEIFPHNYNIYRKDREDGFGGVFNVMINLLAEKSQIDLNAKS